MPRTILVLFACVLLAGVILAGDVIRGAPTSTIGTSGDEDIGGVSEIDSESLEGTEVWEHGGGQLSSITERYRELLNIQSEAKSHVIMAKPSLAQGETSERLLAGIPLLSFEDFSLDWAQVRTVFEQIAVWAAKDSQASGEVKSLKNIARNSSLLKEVVSTWYKGDALTPVAAAQGIDDRLLTFAVGAALKPFLRAYSELLLPEVNQELWRRRYCPICGGKPDFAYLDRERGARWLLCSRCDAEWLFLRLECPYCGTQNQDALAYFTDDEGSYLYLLYVCEQCGTYIKAIDLRRTESEVLLPLERVMTLDMDRQAQEMGYKSGCTTWWQELLKLRAILKNERVLS